MGDTFGEETEQVPCAAMLTRPGPVPGCVYTRLPGDGLVVTRHPASFRGNTAAPGGQKKKNLVQKAMLLLRCFCSPAHR